MRIPRFISVALLVLVAALSSACGYRSFNINIGGDVGSGVAAEETRDIGSIHSVVLNTAGELTIVRGETDSLSIHADDNILPILSSEVADGVLTLDLKHGSNGYTTDLGVQYQLTVTDLSKITANSSSNVKAEALSGDTVTLILNGSGDINVDRIEAEAADFELASAGALEIMNLDARTVALLIGGSGDARIHHLKADTLDARLMSAGDAVLSGEADHQEVRIQGSGSFNGDALAGDDATLALSSSGSAGVNVAETLNVTINGSGSVSYHGDPDLSQQISSSGRVVQAAS